MAHLPLLRLSPGGEAGRLGAPAHPLSQRQPQPIRVGAGHVLAAKEPDEQSDLRCLETEDDDYTTPFYESCWRVLISNPPRGSPAAVRRIFERRQFSVIGPFGHIERFSAWTHFVGAFGFLGYALVRPWTTLDSESTSGRIASYSAALTAVVFFTSTAYHTLGTARWLAAIARTFDHASIDVAIGMASLCDLSIATNGFDRVYWTSVADPVATTMVILLFFLYRRWVLPSHATEAGWGSCKIGIFRMQHSDLEHGALRSAGYVCLAFLFISIAPLIADQPGGLTLIWCNVASVGMLICGLYIDNVLIWPDKWYQQSYTNLGFANRKCGCIVNSHGVWHVLCLVASVLQTLGRESAIHERKLVT